MKKNFLFGLLALMLAGFGFGGISMADGPLICTGESPTATACIGEIGYATVTEAIEAAKAGEIVEVIKEGEYTLPATISNITIKGAVEGVVFVHDANTSLNIAHIPNGATFENVKFKLTESNDSSQWYYHGFGADERGAKVHNTEAIIFKNCIIDGEITTYGTTVFDGCTFIISVDKSLWNVWTWYGDVTFKNCEFKGYDRNIHVHNSGPKALRDTKWNISIDSCKFSKKISSKKSAIVVKESHGTPNEINGDVITPNTSNGVVINYKVAINNPELLTEDNYVDTYLGTNIYMLDYLIGGGTEDGQYLVVTDPAKDYVGNGTLEGRNVVITLNGEEVYATPVIKRDVTLSLHDGTLAGVKNPIKVENNKTVENPGIPTLADKGFKHWATTAGSETAYDFSTPVTAALTLHAVYGDNPVKVTWKNGNTTLKEDTLASGATPTYVGDTPTKAEDSTCNTYEFKEWTPTIAAVSADTTYTATFTCTSKKSSGGSSSGGGGSRKTTTTDDAKATTGDTAKLDEQKADESKSDETKDDETKTSEEAKAAADAQALKDGYSQEFIDAYNFARENNITTKDTIREADMDAPLTRIAMAKMLSQYAINVLGKTPDTSIVVPTFPDVDAKLDADYNNGVTLAYQLGIMGIGIEKFRPFDLVTRAEFGTALSRMLFGLEDGEGNEWYSTHLAKLIEEKIITNDNPNLKELRGYVMIMLMRSAK